MRYKVKDTWPLLKTTYTEWMEKDPFRQSAIIAYYAIFSLPALLVLIITIAGYFFGADAVTSKVLDQVGDTMGHDIADQMKEMLITAQKSKTSIWATIIGVATLLIGATGVFVQLQKTMNIIWEVKMVPTKGIWPIIKERLFSFGLILSIAFLLLISLVISTVLASMSDYMRTDSSQVMMVLMNVINFIVSIIIVAFLFALIYKFLPDAKVRWFHVWVGAIVTSLLFTIGKTGLAFYFGKAEPGSGYGAAGSIILILLWISYSSMILFFGAEFTRAFANYYSGYVPPTENAVKEKLTPRQKEL